jgi:phosphatidylserine/phosphatidylglycerophosphate/cardiolipin synthase-like enzyme
MISSSNLTDAAGFKQWNDLLTTGSGEVYDFLAPIYDQYTRDRAVKDPFQVKTVGDYRVWVYPVGDRNPQASQLRKVRCHGATGGTGTSDGRTRIRVAVAGWFDAYGQEIADELRRLWDRGCDVKVVTTLAGRGVNQTLKARTGRGPVPIRQLSFDNNGDGVPDRYLHQKSMAVSGVFGSDTSASVVMTGSPNWSSRASRSEELWVRVLDRPGMTRRYLDRVDNLYRSRFSSPRLLTRDDLRQALAVHARVTGQAHPEWLELD